MSLLPESASPPRHPWYRERLHRKFLKETNHKLNLSGALNSHQWKFLPKGLDDFRDGYPTSLDTSSISKGHLPLLQNASHTLQPVQKPKKFTKEQVCYSKLLPLQQARREYIDEIEYGLTQHPLALYPHLEEGVPPKLFEDIVEVLDPEMRLKSPLGVYEDNPEDLEEEIPTLAAEQREVQSVKSQSVKSRETSTRLSAMSEQSRLKNPYTWIIKQEEPAKEEKRSKIIRPLTPAVDGNVKQVTTDFCDWVTSLRLTWVGDQPAMSENSDIWNHITEACVSSRDKVMAGADTASLREICTLGGETCSVNESIISSLFATGYDTKPALSVPIHVVELSNVPVELRMSMGVSPRQSITKTSAARIREQLKESTYSPSWIKTRYGAWYLDPKTWKKQKVNEPLKDPMLDYRDKGIHSKTRLSQKDEELLQLHGTNAFKDFVEKKGYRKPEFLNKIFSMKDEVTSEGEMADESRPLSSARSTWYRSGSASTHEESIIN